MPFIMPYNIMLYVNYNNKNKLIFRLTYKNQYNFYMLKIAIRKYHGKKDNIVNVNKTINF